jgi:hypothetical protein
MLLVVTILLVSVLLTNAFQTVPAKVNIRQLPALRHTFNHWPQTFLRNKWNIRSSVVDAIHLSSPKLTQSEALSKMEGYTGGAILSIAGVDVGVADNTLIRSLNWNIMPGDVSIFIVFEE